MTKELNSKLADNLDYQAKQAIDYIQKHDIIGVHKGSLKYQDSLQQYCDFVNDNNLSLQTIRNELTTTKHFGEDLMHHWYIRLNVFSQCLSIMVPIAILLAIPNFMHDAIFTTPRILLGILIGYVIGRNVPRYLASQNSIRPSAYKLFIKMYEIHTDAMELNIQK